MEKNKKLIFVVCILGVLVLVLGSFVVYDKVLAKNDKCIEENLNVDDTNDNSNLPLINKNMSNYTINDIAEKFKSVNSSNVLGSYVEFSNDGTWKVSKGGCEPDSHILVSGIFTIENNKINLEVTSGNYTPINGQLIIVSGDNSNGPTLLFDKDEILADCSWEKYFVIDR